MNDADKKKKKDVKYPVKIFLTITPPIQNNGIDIAISGDAFDLEAGEIIATGARTPDTFPPVSAVIIVDPTATLMQMSPGAVSYPSATTWKATWIYYGTIADNQVLRVEDLDSPYATTQVTINVR